MARVTPRIPPGWLTTTVDKVGTVQLGLMRSPASDSARFPTKYIRAANITAAGLDLSNVYEMDFPPAARERFALRPGDVLLAEASGSPSQVGRAAVWNGEIPDCCFQKTVLRFRPFAALPGFALLVFRHLAASGRFAQSSKGVGIQHLTAVRFSRLSFPLPPHAEQARIVAEVDRRWKEADRGEESLRSALAKLHEQVDHVLAAAVSGELVKDKRRSKESARTTYAFADLGEMAVGRQLTPAASRGPGLRKYLRVANVYEDRLDLSDVKQMAFSTKERARFRLEHGDILLNEGQSIELVGRAAMYRGELKELYFQNTLIRFRANALVLPEFALVIFRHFLRAGHFRKIARRSTNIAHLGLGRFSRLTVAIPPIPEQRRLVDAAHRRLDTCSTQIAAAEKALARLGALRNEIVRAAVTGELVKRNLTLLRRRKARSIRSHRG